MPKVQLVVPTQTSDEKLHKLEPFKEIDSNGTRMSEEVHGVETFERNIHDQPASREDSQVTNRQYSSNTFTERRTYGCDENGEMVIQVEQQPSQPVRPVEPVRPVTPTADLLHISQLGDSFKEVRESPYGSRRYGGNSSPVDSYQPIHIPRINTRSEEQQYSTLKPQNSPSQLGKQSQEKASDQRPHQPASTQDGDPERTARSSRRPASSLCSSSNAGSSSSAASTTGILTLGSAEFPLKKVTRKSRLVSIHDGRPVSPFVESVHYEPLYPVSPRNTSAMSNPAYSPRRQTHFEDSSYPQQYNKSNHLYPEHRPQSSRRSGSRQTHVLQEDDYVTQNPLFVDNLY